MNRNAGPRAAPLRPLGGASVVTHERHLVVRIYGTLRRHRDVRKGNQRTSGDFTVAKFARDGALLWQQAVDGTSHQTDEATSVVVDHEGNVLAAGITQNTVGFRDFAVAKFAGGDGTLLWQQRLNDASDGQDGANSVAVDTEANVLAAGTSFGVFTVAKFAPEGTLLWRQTINGTAFGRDGSANSVVVDTEGNVLAAGTIQNQLTSNDFTVVKFAPDGPLLWQQTLLTFNDILSASDAATSVAVDNEGHVLAAGNIQHELTFDDFTVAKFGTEWSFCASEGGVCTFTGTTEVRYGALGTYVYKILTDGTACSNAVFGDPVVYTVKACEIRSLPARTEWTVCATEGGVCAFTGTAEVRYGADGVYVYQTLTDGIACTNAVFGDPIYGTVKACAFRIPTAPTEWTFCAAEGGVCGFTGTAEVRYGANGAYVYQTLLDGTACTNEVFGDPIYGVVKSCDLRTASPSPPQP